MSILFKLPQILEEGKREYERIKFESHGDFIKAETARNVYGQEESTTRFESEGTGECKGVCESEGKCKIPTYEDSRCAGIIAHGDNLSYMRSLTEALQSKRSDKTGSKIGSKVGSIDLIYIDPPFYSKADYSQEMKIIIDEKTEIPPFKQKAYKDTWDEGLAGYLTMLTTRFFFMKDLLSDKGSLWVHLDWHSSHYVKIILDEIFGDQNFLNEVIWNYKSGGSSKSRFSRKHDSLLFYRKTKKHYFKPLIEKSYNRGMKPYRFKGVKEYEDDLGWYTLVNMKDVWQIDMVGRTSSERTGYATQKPEALLERIIESCTKEGDTCVDFFGGSGTLAAAAHKMNRNWIICDKGNLSALSMQKRMLRAGADFTLLTEQKAFPEPHPGEVQIKAERIYMKEEELVRLTLEKYIPANDAKFYVEEKYKQTIADLISNNSLQLLDYWSIDPEYDGINFIPKAYFIKGKNGIQCVWEFCLGNNYSKKIRIRAVDIFGNSCFQEISLEECMDEKN